MITPELRTAIRSADGSIRRIAARFGVNPKTVAKWRGCADGDFDHRNAALSAPRRILGEVDDWRLLRFRMVTALALDDCLYANQSVYPWLTRSTLYRTFQRFGVTRLSDLVVHQFISRLRPEERLGVCGFYITRVETDEGACDIFAFTDHATKLNLMRVYRPDDPNALIDFRDHVHACFPFPVKTVLLLADFSCTDRQTQAAEQMARPGKRIEILHQPVTVRSQATTDLERPDPDAKAIICKAEMEQTISRFMLRYNFERKIQQIGGLRPAEAAERYGGVSVMQLREAILARLV